MEERRYVVIADDLTGSNDTGIQFLEAGYRSLVILDPAELSSLEDHGATVVDTESRNAAAAEAARVMGAVADYLEPMRGRRIVYKKVDSTLRGNIAVEVAVLEHRLGLPVTVFAPAYPRNGRTVRDGLLLLDGVPVAETEMGRDPRKPVVTSSLQKTLRGEEGWETVRHVARDAIRNGYIPRILSEAGGRGTFSFDGETEEDLRSIVAGVTEVAAPEDVLWVGSAGLAAALVTPKPVLLVVGSLSQKSVDQARYVSGRGIAHPVPVDVETLLECRDDEVRRASAAVTAILRSGRNALLSSSFDAEQSPVRRSADEAQGISRALAAIVAQVLRNVGTGGLFVTGGEVAVEVVRALGGRGVRLVREVEPGIPLVRLLGGPHDGLPVVTKAGGFGGEATMANCVDALLLNEKNRRRGIE
ncbi:MAG TPA: hypothetical protein DIC53_09755 [Synergistaceae bacterium]|nr:hypothetical protein [Synergistaceae bacterium]